MGNLMSVRCKTKRTIHKEPKKNKPRYTLDVKKPLELLYTQQVIEDAKDIFTGIGKLKRYQYKVEIDKSISPCHLDGYQTIKKQAYLKICLDDMEKDAIKKQHNATDWVISLLCTPKPNEKQRVWLKPKVLNQAVQQPHHLYAPTLNVVLSRLAGCLYFSTLGQSSGYWNIEIYCKSGPLLSFNTAHGRYNYKRLPFGARSSRCCGLAFMGPQ